MKYVLILDIGVIYAIKKHDTIVIIHLTNIFSKHTALAQ